MVEQRRERGCEVAERPGDVGQRLFESGGGLGQAGNERAHRRLEAVAALRLPRPRQDLLSHQRQEALARSLRRSCREPLVPVVAGQCARGGQGRIESLARGLPFRSQVTDPAGKPACPAGATTPAGFGPEQPASQLPRFAAGEVRGKGAVRRVEEVVPLVDHVAGRHAPLVARAEGRARRLHHEQRMIGDHHVGAPRLALALLDEAAAVVRAGAVDALAAPVREPEGAAEAEQVGEPGGQVAAGHVAVARGGRPAGHQAKGDALGRHQRAAADGFLHVEQAEVVLAPLAQHHLLGLRLGIGVEPVKLLVDLALQVARVRGEPDRALVALCPEARRRDVAQGLADARAGLRQHHVGVFLRFHRIEGRACRRGIVRLLGPGLRTVAEQVHEALARGCGRDRVVPRRRRRRALLPFLEAGPDGERTRIVVPARTRRPVPAGLQRGCHRIAPGPAGANHDARDCRCLSGTCEAGRCERAEQTSGGLLQG